MANAVGMRPEHILLAPTHTHSGPVTNIDKEGKCRNPVYFEIILKNAAIHAAKEAARNLQPAELGIGTTQSQVAVNRRELDVNGQVVLGQEPLGSYDPTMTVISFRTPEGKILGNIVHYGCHNTASGNGTEITRDWCGVMIDRMDEETGGMTAFVNGCQGDCGPRLPNGKTTGNVKMAQELGGLAGIDAMRAFRSIRRWENEIDLRVLNSTIKLPYGKLATEEAMLRELEELGDPEKLTSEPLIYYNSVMNQLEMVRSGKAAEYEAEGGKSFNFIHKVYQNNVYNQLVYLNLSTGEFEPELAAEWKAESLTSYYFKLRDDITFANGEPLTADDVLYSLYERPVNEATEERPAMKDRNSTPSLKYPFGTDNMGRNLFYRVLYGTKYSMLIGVSVLAFTFAIGLPIGAICGYYGGKVDLFVMRIFNIIGSIPSLLLGIIVVSAFGQEIWVLVIALGISRIGGIAGVARTAVMTVRTAEYLESARAIGMKDMRIIFKHDSKGAIRSIRSQLSHPHQNA